MVSMFAYKIRVFKNSKSILGAKQGMADKKIVFFL